MPADFAAAQARLAARRQRIEAQTQAQRQERDAARSIPTSRLPLPFRSLGDASLTLWDSIKGREGTQPAFRVGQVDAELLDEELLELLKGQVGDALKYYGVCSFSIIALWTEVVLTQVRLIFKLTIPLKSFSSCALFSSSSRYGTITPRTAHHYKAFAIQTLATRACRDRRPRNGKRPSTVSSRYSVGMDGPSGRTIWSTKKVATSLQHPQYESSPA